MDCRIDCYPNVKHIEIDFGEVEVGLTKIKSIKIVNQCNRKQSYTVQRDSASNPLDCVFHTLEYTWCLRPCDSYVCDISFKPILPNRKYTDYFYITDTYKCCYKLVVYGFCIGPNVLSTATRFVMVSKNKNCRAKHCFKLTNQTDVCAKFMFDIDIVQCPFKINEVRGVIKPSSTECFIVTFEPADTGIYKYHMPCLILNQSPIVLELYGISGVLDEKHIEDFRTRIEITDELDTNHFKNYLSDITTAVKSNPPSVSLTCSFIDFGQAAVGLTNAGKRTPQTACLTSHNQGDLLVLWEKDKSGIFSIRPQKAKLRVNQSIIFEVRFDPAKERTFYFRELMARIFRLPCCSTNDEVPDELLIEIIPEFVSIRLIGHTYSYDSNNWMPQYEIPETVTMPACLPALPIYTTFAIRNFGPQPLMFCFIPPATSYYNVKPMMGLISCEQEYQIIAVQLFPEAEGDRAYVERWAVRLNGNPKNEIYIDFQGYVEQANLIFGFENIVVFNPVYVGCQETQPIPVRNATRHTVRYEYASRKLPKELSIQQINGVIHPNETVFHDWTFMPDQLRNYEFDIFCCLSAEIGGRNSSVRIEVSGNSSEGSLIAIPEELRLGDLAYNKECEVQFKAFNFSPVTIHFLLFCRPTKNFEIMRFPENDVKISPKCGTIGPGRGEKIQVLLVPKQPGFYELTIEYFIRQNASTNSTFPLSKPKHLCTLNSMCYLPTIQVKDLLYRAETNKNISKISLWKSLCIDILNAASMDLLPCQETSINMIVPLVSLHKNETFIVKLLLANSNPLEASWCFNKKKTCFCNDRDAKNKFTMNRNLKDGCLFCIHDKSITIYPKKITLKANETVILTIEIKSNTLQPSGIFWDLNIGEERYITLNIKFETSIILSGPSLIFNNIYIGRGSYTHYKVVWLYNDEESENTYTIEMKSIALFNKKNFGIIFTCLNPKGIIQGYTRQPVLFGFCPNKFGKFEVDVFIKIGGKESILSIDAESTSYLTEIVENETCPNPDTFRVSEIISYFNNNYVVLPSLPTHGKITKLIMVHNHHQHDVLHYEWKSYQIPGIVKVSIEPSSGLIQPQTLITFLIEVFVGFYVCSLDIDLFCDFVDVSERRFAEKKKRKHENIVKQLKDEFTITEKGLVSQAIPACEEIKKPSTFCKTLTLKINIYDSHNADETIDLRHQLKSAPSEEIMQQLRIPETNYSRDIFNVSSLIFECTIWEILNDKCFTENLKSMNRVHKLKYSQLPVNIVDRKKQLKRINWSPSQQHIEDILRTMICMIVHEEFNFDTAHFSHPPDVRQISYQKIYTETYNKQINDK